MKIEFTTIGGTRFESNENQTYFYAIWTRNGEQIKKRIKKAEFFSAQRENEIERKAIAEAEAASLDAAAENDEISAEQFVELIEQTEESIATEEAKEIVERMEQEERKEREKKVRKERKVKATKKSAAYVFSNGGAEFTLTAKQVDFIRHLPDTYFWENGVDSEIWIDCLCDDIKGQFEGKPMTVGAMISTLCEKDLGTRATSHRDNRKCTSFALTPWGKAVAKDLGLR